MILPNLLHAKPTKPPSLAADFLMEKVRLPGDDDLIPYSNSPSRTARSSARLVMASFNREGDFGFWHGVQCNERTELTAEWKEETERKIVIVNRCLRVACVRRQDVKSQEVPSIHPSIHPFLPRRERGERGDLWRRRR